MTDADQRGPAGHGVLIVQNATNPDMLPISYIPGHRPPYYGLQPDQRILASMDEFDRYCGECPSSSFGVDTVELSPNVRFAQSYAVALVLGVEDRSERYA